MPPKPLILGFDTSAAHVAAALLFGDQIIAEHFEERAKGQDAALFGVLEGLLAETGNAWRDLEGIGVGVGPGNFTGVRIAVAAAKGLGLSLDIPVYGVSGFDALREGTNASLAAIPAPRGAIYLQVNRSADPKLISEPGNLPLLNPYIDSDYGKLAMERLVGDVSDNWLNHMNAKRVPEALPHAEAIARCAARQMPNAAILGFPKPLYIKSPDAAPPRHPAPTIVP